MLAKKLIFGCIAAACVIGTAVADDDPMDFENFAITTGGDADFTMAPVSLNGDATPVNVAGFDIAGIMLGMPFEDIQTLFFKGSGLYAPRRKNSIVYTIHKDWKYNLDYECRSQGVVIPDEVEKCITGLARRRGLMYASELHLERETTGEKISVYFTSNATDNVVWRVVYTNDVNDLEGPAEKFANQREKKIMAFWQSVLEKYGAPNSDTDKWITTDNSYDPMMTAYYGSLDLMDVGRYSADQAKNLQAARENFQAKPYAF